MTDTVDLTQHSLTFPDLPKPQIPRDDLVEWLYARFTPDRKVIVVQGPDGAGKTTLLAQFAKAYPDRCFCYFVKKDYWASDPQRFLTELCTQMQIAVHGREDDIEGSYFELKQLFGKLYHQVAKKARRLKQPFYFVVDGLEWVSESYVKDNITDLLPHDPLDGTYLLASSASGQEFRFAHDTYPIHFFSPTETVDYLRDVLDKEKAQRVHDVCKGMPGYLSQIHRELQMGRSVDELLDNLPEGFQELLEQQWKRMEIEDECTLDALAVLAHSTMPLGLPTLAEVVSTSDEKLKACLASAPIVQFGPDDQVFHFISDAHRHFIADRLSNRRGQIEKILVDYYARDPLSRLSLVQLPILLKQTKRYNALKDLVNVEYLGRTLQETKEMYLLRRNVRIVADDAYRLEDWQTLSKYALMSSILRELSTKSAVESEVEALLALGDYQQSFDIAYQATLPEDCLQLLAKIGSYLKRHERPIPNEVLSDLERMVSEIDPAGSLRERVIEIAADLFYVHSQAALDLVEKVAGADTSERSIDVILAVLAVKLEGEASDTVEALRSRISDQSLRDFARVSSPVVADLKPEQVLAETEKIKSTSGKLFLLRSWCNANRDNHLAIKVVDVALEIMTASTDYSPSMRHLRQFAEPLISSEDEEVYRLVDRFDLLRDTAIQKPAEEAVRLEMLLASVEARRSLDEATNRLYRVYLSLDDLSELDTRCYCFVRILLALPSVDPSDSGLVSEVERRLAEDYQILLDGSADHLTSTRRILRALTNYKPEMAVEFAGKLNTLKRRDKAFSEILRVYASHDPDSIDLSFVEDVLARISEKEQRDLAFVRMLESFVDKDMFKRIPQSRHFISRIPELHDPTGQSFAYARSLQMMASADDSRATQELFNNVVEAWSKIDEKWQKVQTGFDLVAIIAGSAPELAQKMLDQTRAERRTTPLAENIFAGLYINTLQLAIRAFSDIIKGQDYVTMRGKLIEAISRVPSCSVQCKLLAGLALRHYLAGNEQDFRKLVKENVLEALNNCQDAEARDWATIQIAPCLFQYERNLLKDELLQLSPSRRDEALSKVVVYLLSGRPMDDPVDLDSLTVPVDYIHALQTCEVLEQMSTDSDIYGLFSRLVATLVKQGTRNREECIFIEKNALSIAKRLQKISTKFPDRNNIQHKGYWVAAQASIARIRAGAAQRSPYRASEQWENVALSCVDIAQAARAIPNAADKALVMAWVGAEIYRSEPALACELLEEAKECIEKIPNLIDRGARLHALAEAWQKADDKESAKFFLKEAMSILEGWRWDRARDQITGQILQLAHSLDSEFAASLTSIVDNSFIEHSLEQDLAASDLQVQPSKIRDQEQDVEELQHILSRASLHLLRSLCSGKGLIQPESLVGEWTHSAIDARIEEVHRIFAWSIENDLARTQKLKAPALSDIYFGLLDSLQLIWLIGEMLLGAERDEFRQRNPAMPSNLQLFSVGSRDEALAALQDWLRENADSYLKIHDPYFTAADLEILKCIPTDVRVYILTSWLAQEVRASDIDTVQRRYKDAWARISDQQPPETHVYILGIKSTRESPMHDRYYISAGDRGIEIGTSRSGLGKKDSYIRILDPDEVAVIEADRINRLLVSPPSHFKGEQLIIRTFTLTL